MEGYVRVKLQERSYPIMCPVCMVDGVEDNILGGKDRKSVV